MLEELKINHIFCPPYSPEYNAIEFYFSLLKKNVKALRLKDMVKGIKTSFKELVPLAIEMIDKKTINSYIEHVCNLLNIN